MTGNMEEHRSILDLDWQLSGRWMLACYCCLSDNSWRLSHDQREHWKPPPHGVVKVNCDGGFYPDNMTGSIGVVIGNSEGSFLGASSSWLPVISPALIAEGEACRHGLRLVVERGFRRLIIESDSLQFVSLWKNRKEQRSEIVAILKEMEELASTMISFECIHIRRSANEVAHLCAKHVISLSTSSVWHEPPSFLVLSLQRDCNSDDE
jgi:ribonuclease HI